MTFDARSFLTAQFEFSDKTFGPGQRWKGVVAHIRKELNEIEQDPQDRVEWIDVVLLGCDGCRRAGHSLDVMLAQWPGGALSDWRASLEQQFQADRQAFGEEADPLGVLPTIRFNLELVDQDPDNLVAWLSIVCLAFEGGRLTGATADELLATLADKFARNQSRVWPDWRTFAPDRPIEHDRRHD